MKLSITTATMKGQRSYQEDRLVVHQDERGTLLAVIDGHGGQLTAEFAAKHLVEHFNEQYELLTSMADQVDNLPLAILESTIVRLGERLQSFDNGAVISAVFSNDTEEIYVAILGDAPVFTRLADGTIHLSPEHNVRTNFEERKAAEARGGVMYNGYVCNSQGVGLQISRALGDRAMKGIISYEPQVYSIVPNDFIVVASDGVLDPGHGDPQVVLKHLATMLDDGAVAQNLVEDALIRETGDNATAIVARIE